MLKREPFRAPFLKYVGILFLNSSLPIFATSATYFDILVVKH